MGAHPDAVERLPGRDGPLPSAMFTGFIPVGRDGKTDQWHYYTLSNRVLLCANMLTVCIEGTCIDRSGLLRRTTNKAPICAGHLLDLRQWLRLRSPDLLPAQPPRALYRHDDRRNETELESPTVADSAARAVRALVVRVGRRVIRHQHMRIPSIVEGLRQKEHVHVSLVRPHL